MTFVRDLLQDAELVVTSYFNRRLENGSPIASTYTGPTSHFTLPSVLLYFAYLLPCKAFRNTSLSCLHVMFQWSSSAATVKHKMRVDSSHTSRGSLSYWTITGQADLASFLGSSRQREGHIKGKDWIGSAMRSFLCLKLIHYTWPWHLFQEWGNQTIICRGHPGLKCLSSTAIHELSLLWIITTNDSHFTKRLIDSKYLALR